MGQRLDEMLTRQIVKEVLEEVFGFSVSDKDAQTVLDNLVALDSLKTDDDICSACGEPKKYHVGKYKFCKNSPHVFTKKVG
jgi:hypothetical protein